MRLNNSKKLRIPRTKGAPQSSIPSNELNSLVVHDHLLDLLVLVDDLGVAEARELLAGPELELASQSTKWQILYGNL